MSYHIICPAPLFLFLFPYSLILFPFFYIVCSFPPSLPLTVLSSFIYFNLILHSTTTARFAGTSGVRPPVATDSGSHTTFLASLTLEGTARAALPFRDRSALPSALPSDDDRNPTAESAFWSRNADRIRCPPDSPDASGRDWYAWVVTLYGSLPPLGSVPGVDGLASILPLTRAVLHELRFGIDYHVVPVCAVQKKMSFLSDLI